MSNNNDNDSSQTSNDPASSTTDIANQAPSLIGFYGMWVVFAFISEWLGHSTVHTGGAMFMLGGVVATSFFFLTVTSSEHWDHGRDDLLALYQSILAIAWASAYLYFSEGANEIVLGMYLTTLVFAVFHLNVRQLSALAVGVLASYALVLGIKGLAAPALIEPLADGLRFMVLSALVVWLYTAAVKLRNLRHELQFRNEELQRVLARVTRIAERDHLTKSYNRRHIMELLLREKARADRSGHPFSVLLFDLDHFKAVNDRFGHIVGDQILSDFANLVKQELRGMDMVNQTEPKRSFGRYGGEEFLAVLPGTDARGAQFCADRIRRIISQNAFRDRYNITVSAGVAEYIIGEKVTQFLTRADDALYQAKRDGRNRVVCSNPPEKEDTGTVPNLRILK